MNKAALKGKTVMEKRKIVTVMTLIKQCQMQKRVLMMSNMTTKGIMKRTMNMTVNDKQGNSHDSHDSCNDYHDYFLAHH